MEDLERYLELLKVNAIIYDDEIEKDFDYDECRNYLLDDTFLEYLYAKVKTNEITETMDDKVKNNIRNVLFFIRYEQPTCPKEKIEKINEILVSINSASSKNSSIFYQTQYLKRSGLLSKKDEKLYDKDIFVEESEMLEAIRYSIMMDYDTIYQILNSSDEEFINENVKNELLDDYFMNTIYLVLSEQKELFENPLFKKRVIYVLRSIKEVILNKSKLYKKDDSKELDLESYLRANKLLRKVKKS